MKFIGPHRHALPSQDMACLRAGWMTCSIIW